MNAIGHFFQPAGLKQEFPSHVQWSGANRILSPPEAEAVVGYGEKLGWAAGAIGGPQANRVDPGYRCVDVCTLPFTEKLAWLYERITQRVSSANDGYYGFDLNGLLEPIQLLRYTTPPEGINVPAGHYNWHQDFGAGYMGRRKLSVVIQLSDAGEYEGCELTLMSHRLETMPYRAIGEGVVFPSWTPHCVGEIKRGLRHALVAWIHGVPFR